MEFEDRGDADFFWSEVNFPSYHWFISKNREYPLIRVNGFPFASYVRSCFHGWVILSGSLGHLWVLWNPLTSKSIRLPKIIQKQNQENYDACCLTSPPGDQGSIFLVTQAEAPTIAFCRLDHKRKRKRWTEMSYAKQLWNISGGVKCFLECPTCCNGKVYAMTSGNFYRFVIQIDIVIKRGEKVVILLPVVKINDTPPPTRCPSYDGSHEVRSFLKGSCNELFYIEVYFNDRHKESIGDVRLFTLNMTSMTWEEMVDLKDATFFIEGACDDYVPCNVNYNSRVGSELKGWVHILSLSHYCRLLYSFNVKDRTVSISSIPDTVTKSQPWALLEWRSKVDDEQENATEIVVKDDDMKFDIATGESRMQNMSIDILEMIMERCIGMEYTRLRATCKHCYLAAPPSNETTLRRLQMYSSSSPWLMVLDNYRGIITFTDPIRGDRYCIKKPQELKGDYQICCSRYGWLLMDRIDEHGPLVFYNPVTNDIRELPAAQAHTDGSFCFSAPPTSPDCMVVNCMVLGLPRSVWLAFTHFVSRQSTDTWRTFYFNAADGDYKYYRFPTFKSQDLFVLNNNRGLDAIKRFTEDNFSWEVVVHDDYTRVSDFRSFLSSCDQHVLLVMVSEIGKQVQVFKLDEESTGGWEKIDGLGNHVIYISDTSCICMEAKSPEMGNKIYFPVSLHNDGMKMVFYSLETCSYHTFDDKNIQESLGDDHLGTKYHCNPHTWIEPSWS